MVWDKVIEKEEHRGAQRLGSISLLIARRTPSMQTIGAMNAEEVNVSRPDLSYFLVLHDMASLPREKTNPDVDCLLAL